MVWLVQHEDCLNPFTERRNDQTESETIRFKHIENNTDYKIIQGKDLNFYKSLVMMALYTE